MRYKTVPGSHGASQQFEIVSGLQEGYGPTGIFHTADEAAVAIEAVLRKQAAVAGQDGLVLSGTVVAVTTVYA